MTLALCEYCDDNEMKDYIEQVHRKTKGAQRANLNNGWTERTDGQSNL